jgi:uncharacterized protein (DUF58 family)
VTAVAPGRAPAAAPARPGAPGALAFRVSWSLSGHARRLLTLALAGLAIALVTGRAEFAGLAAPALLLLAAWWPRRPAQVTVAVRVTARQLVEGDEAGVIATISGHGDYAVQATITATEAFSAPRAAEERPGTGELRVPFRAERWGIRRIGSLEIVLRDRFRLAEGRLRVELPVVDCHPLPATLRNRMVLSRLPSRLGEHPSRASGEGVEFSGIREFVPGDRQRRINWPATTRSGTLQLNTFIAERTQNVVVIADATTNVGEPGLTSLDLAFRAAAGVLSAYLAGGDRAGLVVYADRISWIGPGQGRRHFHRLMDLLLSSHRGWERARGLTRLPRAALPPGALIVVFSPLLYAPLVESLRDLRERGFSVIVIDVLTAEPDLWRDRAAGLARRIWRLEQQAIRFSLTELGIPVVRWDGRMSLDESLAPYTRRVMLAGRT